MENKTYLAAFRIGMRYCERLEDMPYSSAWVITKVKGKNMPQKKQKEAATVNENLRSLSGLTKLIGSTGFLVCVNRDRKTRLDIPSINRIRKAQILIAQGNPTSGMRCDTMIGKITPPKLDPEAITPRAKARRFPNQVTTEFTQALKMALAPSALQIPCARMN